MAARNEVLAVQVERERAELERLRASNAARTAGADLVRLLGMPPGTEILPSEPLESAPRTAAADRGDGEVRPRGPAGARPPSWRGSPRPRRGSTRRGPAGRPQLSASAGYDYAEAEPPLLPLEETWNDSWTSPSA